MAREIIYGAYNGSSYQQREFDEKGNVVKDEPRTHWDSMLEITHFGEGNAGVQVGVIPPAKGSEESAEGGSWSHEDGQFLMLSRDGCNRLIRTIRKYRDTAFGKDE